MPALGYKHFNDDNRSQQYALVHCHESSDCPHGSYCDAMLNFCESCKRICEYHWKDCLNYCPEEYHTTTVTSTATTTTVAHPGSSSQAPTIYDVSKDQVASGAISMGIFVPLTLVLAVLVIAIVAVIVWLCCQMCEDRKQTASRQGSTRVSNHDSDTVGGGSTRGSEIRADEPPIQAQDNANAGAALLESALLLPHFTRQETVEAGKKTTATQTQPAPGSSIRYMKQNTRH